MRSKMKPRISSAGHEVGKWTRIIVFISTTRVAILMRRGRSVSNWAVRRARSSISALRREFPTSTSTRRRGGTTETDWPSLSCRKCDRPPGASSKTWSGFRRGRAGNRGSRKGAGVAIFHIGGNEARVGSVCADFDTRVDALDPTPAFGAAEELLEAAQLALAGRGLESHLRRGSETLDMTAQRRRRRDSEKLVEAVGVKGGSRHRYRVLTAGPPSGRGRNRVV